ncbi:flagellar basal-body rod protein FlgG [Salipiger sp. PrR003]|uniref:flagellar basal-body rod protein FlgG n=1 Tax=Salipiger sp. PrR003 TaxID=2706776 RepID=UPI0013DD0BE1|nr:flagellar basal-body rod protein FlgG [Salipiger sp. PrR003]NDV50769.1 flagellar basal-body rod protein FlgG [Salipiger sp. PrR003]
MKALSIAATGMQAQQFNVEVTSNNIANMNTTGFKTRRAEFQDLMYQSQDRSGSLTSNSGTIRPVGVDVGLGVRAAGVTRIGTQGSLANTDNKLDLAIDGQGLFQVNMPDGTTAYTRAGAFQLSPEGMIVTNEGHEVAPGIAVPENTVDIEINQQGVVMAYVGNDTEPQELGQLTIATFTNEAGLKALGGNLLQETPASGAAINGEPGEPGFGRLMQGYVEQSNVSTIQEITKLISAQRAYEMNSKVVETADQMMSTSSNMR